MLVLVEIHNKYYIYNYDPKTDVSVLVDLNFSQSGENDYIKAIGLRY